MKCSRKLCIFGLVLAVLSIDAFQSLRPRPHIEVRPDSFESSLRTFTRFPSLSTEFQRPSLYDSKQSNADYRSSNLDLLNGPVQTRTVTQAISWAGFAMVSYLLKPFYAIIICTFYFSVIGNSTVKIFQTVYGKLLEAFGKYLPRDIRQKMQNVPRRVFATVYAFLLITILTRFCVYLFPKIMKESQYFVQIAKSEDPYTLFAPFLSDTFGTDGLSQLENVLKVVAGEKGRAWIEAAGQPSRNLTDRVGKLLQYLFTGYLNQAVSIVKRIISNSTNALYCGSLGLLFSLMITWDLPNIKAGVRKLGESRLAATYDELAPKLTAFRDILAQGFEVQALISLVNCILTTIGLIALKIPGVEFFSLLTFVSTFIPIAGIPIATVPPLIVALTEFGISKCYQLLMMVIGVHAVEAYILFPSIYSLKLKLHPLLVLVSLALAEHFAGILGLFLALPVTVFVTNNLLFPASAAPLKAPHEETHTTMEH